MPEAEDTFGTESSPTPTAVKTLELRLRVEQPDPADTASREYSGDYTFYILDEEGAPRWLRQGDLRPHLTAAQKAALKDFLDSMMDKAQGTVP